MMLNDKFINFHQILLFFEFNKSQSRILKMMAKDKKSILQLPNAECHNA